MMSDILLEHTRSQEDANYNVVKERVQVIMETLINEKQQFQRSYQRKIAHYEEEIRKKDNVIKDLSQQLQSSRSQCEKAIREVDVYKTMIHDLKQEFHRMEIVVSQAAPRKDEKELKRVKSDYISSKQRKDVNNHHGSIFRSKSKKFQINNYFQDLKVHTPEAIYHLPQTVKREPKLFKDNSSNASKTIKFNQFHLNNGGGKDGCSSLARTMQKWVQKDNWPSPIAQKKENHVRIRDFKENQWQQTF